MPLRPCFPHSCVPGSAHIAWVCPISSFNNSHPSVEEYSVGQQSEPNQTVSSLSNPYSDVCPFIYPESTHSYESTPFFHDSTIGSAARNYPTSQYTSIFSHATKPILHAAKPILPTDLQTTKSGTSRRKIQRRQRRINKKRLIEENKKLSQLLSQKIQNIKHVYNFTSDPNKSKRLNFNSSLIDTVKSKNERVQASITSSNRHLPLQMLQPQNLTVHNLCSDSQQPPPGTRNLLGLGLKFCHATPRANPDIKSCLKKLAYKIRTKQFLLDNPRHDHSTYIPQLYVKLKHWNPPPASNEVEDQLVHFEKKIKAAVARNASQKTPYSSLTPLQRSTLQELRESKDFIIMPTDKNLGPAIMNYESYVQQVLSEHLLTSSYQFLEPNTANQRLLHTKNLLTTAFYNNKHLLSTADFESINLTEDSQVYLFLTKRVRVLRYLVWFNRGA